MSRCTNCGICCKLDDGSYCKWLRWKPNGKSYCRVFYTRLGRALGRGFHCWPIMKVNVFFKNCPYNILKLTNFLRGR